MYKQRVTMVHWNNAHSKTLTPRNTYYALCAVEFTVQIVPRNRIIVLTVRVLFITPTDCYQRHRFIRKVFRFYVLITVLHKAKLINLFPWFAHRFQVIIMHSYTHGFGLRFCNIYSFVSKKCYNFISRTWVILNYQKAFSI